MTISQMGTPGGQHSGDAMCVMRYDVSGAYASTAEPHVRYFAFEEPFGRSFCRTSAGTGPNDPGHAPQSRYGEARRGGCLHQICVNDRHTH
jgi:hypothetical protein